MNHAGRAVILGLTVLLPCALAAAGCSSNPVGKPAPTIEPGGPAASPPVTVAPAGVVRPLPGGAQATTFDADTSSLVVFSPGPDRQSPAIVTLFPAMGGPPRNVALPGPATALTCDDRGAAYLTTHGGYYRVDLAAGRVDRVGVDGQDATDFTAVARRADGRLVLGSADGAVYTLDSASHVATQVKIFARVDELATEGNTAVVLDRGQTSVTTLDASGAHPQHALRAGEGATTLAADPAGRVLVADTRGDELLVFGVDPLILRQQYPVREAPYGLAGSRTLAWVSETAANMVVGYDLATGIPVEKVRYPTVRQPNSLAFDEARGTLYVVSGTGDGVQAIDHAAGSA
jgi:DNA-binding beta-propeller fold protein YncE